MQSVSAACLGLQRSVDSPPAQVLDGRCASGVTSLANGSAAKSQSTAQREARSGATQSIEIFHSISTRYGVVDYDDVLGKQDFILHISPPNLRFVQSRKKMSIE